jgi:hypothetical protein
MAPEICASDPRARRSTSTKFGFRHNFSKNDLLDLKMVSRKTAPAILYNLREKSGPKIKIDKVTVILDLNCLFVANPLK